MPAIVDRVAALLRAEQSVPLSISTRAPLDDDRVAAPAVACRLELTSRGDRIPLALWRPDAQRSAPLVLLQYGLGERIDAVHGAAVRLLLGEGLAVATVDWPLHGERASAKFGARLLAALDPRVPDRGAAHLVAQFAAQAALDVCRALDAVIATGAADAGRVALVGRGLAASLCALAAAADPRPAALLVAAPSAESGAAELELAPLLAAGRARSVLLRADAPPAATPAADLDALRAACPGQARIVPPTRGREPVDAALARALATLLRG